MTASGPTIRQQLERLARSQAGLHARVGRLGDRCQPCQAKVAEHDRAIRGSNGDGGLETRLTVVERATADLARAQTRAFWSALAFFSTGVLTLLGSIVALLAK